MGQVPVGTERPKSVIRKLQIIWIGQPRRKAEHWRAQENATLDTQGSTGKAQALEIAVHAIFRTVVALRDARMGQRSIAPPLTGRSRMNQPPGGEADPNRWYFAKHGEEGPLPNPSGHTFPLLTHDETGKWSLVGTGFYVSDNGLFVTARHVVEHVCRDGKQALPLVILHLHSDVGLFGPSECLFRPIMQCWLGAKEDIAFGVAATATNSKTGQQLSNWTWTLSWQTTAERRSGRNVCVSKSHTVRQWYAHFV
jgi:hypothetical protein